MLSDSDRRRITLEYADLVKEQEACNNQYRSAIDDAQRIRLKRKLDDYDKKIKNLENQLYKQDLSQNSDNNRRSRALEEKLSKIDFKKQISIIKNILEEFVEYGNAVLFVNDGLYMAGDLFSVELKKILQEETTDLKHYDIAFTVGGSLDEIGFLQVLAGYLGIDDIRKKDDYYIIIEKLFNLIQNGTIVFIELRKIDLLESKDSFLCWLINNFCKSLNDNLTRTCQSQDIEQVRLIILVSSDDDILEECSNLEFFCDEEDFNENQIFSITLTHWSEKDISLWLTKHSGLPKNQIISMAKSIYRSSRGGTPKLICDALRSKLS